MLRSALNLLRLATTSTSTAVLPTASTSRSLATISTLPSILSSSESTPHSKPTQGRATRKSTIKRNRFIVPSPSSDAPPPRTPRYSANSSRIKGRTESPTARSKLLSLTPKQEPSVAYPDNQYVQSTVGETKIYLPSVFFRLVRNTGAYANDPYTATFRTDLRLTKLDISNYLKNIYGLGITSVRTMNYLSALKRNPIGGGYSRAGTTKNYKKVLVSLEEPFWYPEERGREWCNDHFQRDRMEELKDRRMLRVGDGQKYGVGSFRYRGAGRSQADLNMLKLASEKGSEEATMLPGAGQPYNSADRRKTGLKRAGNVLRSKEERVSEKKDKIGREMDRLKDAGW